MEAALSVYLEGFATTLGSREQLAIAEFASALLVLPKTLAVNAAKDATVRECARRLYIGSRRRRTLKQGGAREGRWASNATKDATVRSPAVCGCVRGEEEDEEEDVRTGRANEFGGGWGGDASTCRQGRQ